MSHWRPGRREGVRTRTTRKPEHPVSFKPRKPARAGEVRMREDRPPEQVGGFFVCASDHLYRNGEIAMNTPKARRFLLEAHVIVFVLALSAVAASPTSAGDAAGRAASCAPVQPHRVIVQGPMQQPLPAMSSCAPQKAPVCAPAKIRTAPPKSASPFPHLIPLEIRDSGPIKPIVAHTVWLAGALIAAPFRLLETVAPIGHISGYAHGEGPLPSPAVPCLQHGAPPRALPWAGLPPFMPAGNAYGHGPSYPTGNASPSSQENRFPQVEPQSLLGGIVQFPATMVTQGRTLGDLGSSSQCAP